MKHTDLSWRGKSDRAAIEARVIDVLRTEITFRDGVTLEQRLVADLNCDSLDLVEITMSIEQEFSIDIPDSAAEQFRTGQDIADYVAKVLG